MNTWKKLKFLLKYGTFNPKRINGIDCETWRNINISKDGLFLKTNPGSIVYQMYIRASLVKDSNGKYLNNKQATYVAVELAIHATSFLYGDSYTELLLNAWDHRKKLLEK